MLGEFRMNRKRLSKLAVILFVIPIIILGFISLVDRDKTVSAEENRTLKKKPEFSFASLLSGNYTKEFDEYYSDTFPGRSGFMKISKTITAFFTQNSAGTDDIVIINHEGDKNDFAGESLMDDDEWMKSQKQ